MTLENRPSKIEAAAKTQAHSDPYFSVRMDVYASGTFPSHEHQYFEILLQLSGNRTQHLGMRDIPLDEGHLICIGQGVPHSAIIHSESISLVIGFNLAFLCPELPIYAAESWSRPSVLEAAPQLLPFAAQPSMDFHCSLALTKTLQEIGSDLMTKSGSKRIGAKTYARAKLSLFLLTVVEHFEDGLVEAASSSFLSKFGSERVDELISFIQENLAAPISIDDAARKLNISPSCLAARIRRVTGKSFGELLLEARLTRAKELLLFREDRISEIAYATGFEDHAYFSRRFRQLTGLTPGNYRKIGVPNKSQRGAH
jgi:AraC-like DNA-binding protein/mannose-6-phosphate isomerase-like protein (cupin superfamily)